MITFYYLWCIVAFIYNILFVIYNRSVVITGMNYD